MLRFLFDTDHLTLYEHGHPKLIQRLAVEPIGTVGLSAVTVEESLRGRLAVLARSKDGDERVRRYHHLTEAVQLLNQFPIATYDKTAEDEFQRLKSMRLKVGSQDLKIGATALVNAVTLLSRNRQDFGQIPGLLLDDWSA